MWTSRVARALAPVARQSVKSLTTGAAAAEAPRWQFAVRATAFLGVGTGAAVAYGEMLPAMAEEEQVHPSHQMWSHSGKFDTFDHASIRRGYEVYRQVCAACHSMDRLAFRNLVGEIYSEDEMKDLCAEVEIKNKEPNDDGEYYMRPAKLFDYFPAPYENEVLSRKANSGALPPDLSVITKARHGNEDYVFALLTGYCDEPAGVTIAEGQNFNPYFPGSKIGMGAPLYDEIIEYEDGTPASLSQLAKDVSTFLAWSAEPEHDERKRMGLKALTMLSMLGAFLLYAKRQKWAPLKSRVVTYQPGAFKQVKY